MAGAAVPPPLTDDQKNAWNGFIDYLDKAGYKGSSALDNRNMALGQNLLNKYNQMRPGAQINYADIARVQQELQQYRSHLINQWKANPSITNAKSADEIMPGISKVDGWLGSKTSSYKFPTAVITNSDGTQANFGTNTQAYDKAVAAIKK